MPPETDNLKLEELFLADQKDRTKVYDSPAALKDLEHRDSMRRALVAEMISRGEVSTPNDLYHAAVIYLHGSEPKHYLTAHRFAAMASINGHRPSRWLMAATLDRFLMSLGQPQVYGTQFEHDKESGQYQLRLPIDDNAVLSFEKKFFNVPTVAERLEQLNGRLKAK